MQLLATFTPRDADPQAPDFELATFTPRTAARAIVFDGQKVALLYLQTHKYYMLPGGGVESGEDLTAALQRELLEEIGCSVTVIGQVGSAAVYFDRWHRVQTDHCFIARKQDQTIDVSATAFEIQEGHTVVWADDLLSAIRLLKSARPLQRDGKLVQMRDALFLDTFAATKR